MSTAVITGVSHHHEQELVSAVDAAPGVTVVRRCADVAELMSTGASGVADVAVVSSDFRGLDRDALRHLAGHGVRVAGLVVAGDESAEARLRQLGVTTLLRPGTDPGELSRVLQDLAGGVTSAAPEGSADGPSRTTGATGTTGTDRSGAEERSGGISDAELEQLLRDPSGGAASGGAASGVTARSGEGSRAGEAGLAGPGDGGLGGRGQTGAPLSGAASGAALGAHEDDDVFGDGSRRARLTAVWGPTGAPGRTTVAVTLAADLAARGVRTLLVDLDTWGASVSQSLALIDEAPGVAAAARASEQGTLDSASLARVAPEVSSGLRVLTGIPKPERWPELRAAAVEDVLEKARALVDHVVVDCGFAIEDDEELSYDTAAPRRNATTLAALEASDHLLVVGSADPIGLQRLVRAVQDVGVVRSAEPVIVVNKVRASATGAKPEKAIGDVLGRFAGLEEPHFVPWAPQECDAALLAGRSLVESAPTATVTRAVSRLASLVHPEVVASAEGRVSRREAKEARSAKESRSGKGGRVGRFVRR